MLYFGNDKNTKNLFKIAVPELLLTLSCKYDRYLLPVFLFVMTHANKVRESEITLGMMYRQFFPHSVEYDDDAEELTKALYYLTQDEDVDKPEELEPLSYFDIDTSFPWYDEMFDGDKSDAIRYWNEPFVVYSDTVDDGRKFVSMSFAEYKYVCNVIGGLDTAAQMDATILINLYLLLKNHIQMNKYKGNPAYMADKTLANKMAAPVNTISVYLKLLSAMKLIEMESTSQTSRTYTDTDEWLEYYDIDDESITDDFPWTKIVGILAGEDGEDDEQEDGDTEEGEDDDELDEFLL